MQKISGCFAAMIAKQRSIIIVLSRVIFFILRRTGRTGFMPTVRLYGPQWAVRMTISGPIGGILCLYAIGANGRDSAGMKTTRLRFLEPGLLYFIGFYQNNPSCAGNKRRKEHIE